MAIFNANTTSLLASQEREDPFVPVDAERPWMVVPRQEKVMRNSPFNVYGGNKAPQSSFRPLSTLEVGKLDAETRVDYFADYKQAATKAAGLGLLAAVSGGFPGTVTGEQIGSGFIQPASATGNPMAAYEAQASAFGLGTPLPTVPGSFLPRAMQGRRSPTAPGAR